MTEIVGIDPSQRHTGLCLLREAGPIFHEIKTEDQDVLTSAGTLRRELRTFLRENKAEKAIICMEKQLSVGGQSSTLLFHMQMNVLEVVKQFNDDPTLIMPLPIQLISYIKKKHGGDTTSAGTIVAHFKNTTGWKGRISQHCVDGYYLARLGKDVLSGVWSYKLPSKEAPLHPWRTTNGKQ